MSVFYRGVNKVLIREDTQMVCIARSVVPNSMSFEGDHIQSTAVVMSGVSLLSIVQLLEHLSCGAGKLLL